MNKEYLEALEGMFDLIKSQGSFEKAQKYFDIIEEALITKFKKEWAWDIVVKKNVNIGLLKGTIKMVERGDTNWEYYNRVIMDERIDKKDCLTEE